MKTDFVFEDGFFCDPILISNVYINSG
jgi:hypothetical protein